MCLEGFHEGKLVDEWSKDSELTETFRGQKKCSRVEIQSNRKVMGTLEAASKKPGAEAVFPYNL